MGDFLLAITARLEIMIEKTAAAKGAATANPILLGLNFLVSELLMPHPSSQNLVAQVLSLQDQVQR